MTVRPVAGEARTAPPAIELRHLRYFLAVYEELHFGRAAKRLHIAQPPLSQSVRKLESHLGVKLLHRTSRAVSATEAGRVFADESRKVLQALDAAVADARRASVPSPLRIGCVPYLPIASLLQLLGALDVRLPALPTQVTHAHPAEQVSRLRAGELDVAIVTEAGDYTQIEVEPFLPGRPLVAVVPADHPLAGRPHLTPADVEGQTLVMFPRAQNPPLFEHVLGVLRDSGYRFGGIHEVGGDGARDLILGVLSSCGVAVSSILAEEETSGLECVTRVPLEPPVNGPDLVLAWRVDPPQHLVPAVEAVREVAREIARRRD